MIGLVCAGESGLEEPAPLPARDPNPLYHGDDLVGQPRARGV